MSDRPRSSRASAGRLMATWLNRGWRFFFAEASVTALVLPLGDRLRSVEPGRAQRLGTQTVAQGKGDEHPEDEAADVGHPRHARAGAGEELQHEPEPKEPHGG